MYVDKEIKELREKQGSRTGVAFIIGAILGAVFGMDVFIALASGLVAGGVVWLGYSGDIERKEKRRTLNGD